jgi:hypothetical protein
VQVGDVVTLTDARGENTGKVVKLTPVAGMVTVLWDSGVQEQVHESELKRIGIAADPPAKKTETLRDEVWDADEGRIDPALLAEEAADDPAPVKKTETLKSVEPEWEGDVMEAPAVPKSGRPVSVESLLTDEDHAVMADEDNSGYHVDDPKHPTFRERLSALWDSRPGK